MEADLRHHLLTTANAYAAARGLKSLGTVGRLAAGDWRFFTSIGDDITFTARKYDSVMAWFSANWPEGAAWPADVPRTDAASAA